MLRLTRRPKQGSQVKHNW